MNTKHKWFLAFKLLMLIIVKTIIYFKFKLTFVLAFQSTAATSNWNKNSKEKTSMFEWKITGLRSKMWCYTLMFGKKYFNHASLLLCIYIYIYEPNPYIYRDPGWLNWEFYYKTFSFYYWGPSGCTGDIC